jgi:glutamate formiminotransferase/formiminotetrahydrofolate cyclodeaminase
MVARLSTGKKKFLEIEPRMKEITEEAENLREGMTEAVEEDAGAFTGVMQAYRLSKSTEEERAHRLQAIEDALQYAVDVPMRVTKASIRIMELALEVARDGNVNAISDAGTAWAVASGAARSASMNVRINALTTTDKRASENWVNKIEALDKSAEKLSKEIVSILKDRGGI